MAYQYSGWASQPTIRAQYDMINLYLGELQERIDREKSSGPHHQGSYALSAIYNSVMAERRRLEEKLNIPIESSRRTSPVTVAKLLSRRDVS